MRKIDDETFMDLSRIDYIIFTINDTSRTEGFFAKRKIVTKKYGFCISVRGKINEFYSDTKEDWLDLQRKIDEMLPL